jgi:ankyrin repeat protein
MNLFRKKSSPNFSLRSLFTAIQKGNQDIVKNILTTHPYFTNVQNNDNMTPLKLAAQYGHLEIIKFLVKMGAEVYSNPMSSYPAVMDAAWNKQQIIVDYFLHEIPDRAIGTNGLGVTINLAGRQGWTEIVKKHIEIDPLSVHQRGWIGDTPLHWPCHNGYVDIVNLLIDNGADIEADEINWIGGKPLHWASEHSPETTKILLENGANVNALNEKKDSPCYARTPLIHNAAQGDDCDEVTKFLLEAGADMNIKESNGKTAFQMAKEKNNLRIISVLQDFT